MAESPASRTPYEVLGVNASASADELRRAYRRMLRETHPDTGGSAARFHELQVAWERVGTPAGRDAYDRGRGATWTVPSGAGAPPTRTAAAGADSAHAGAGSHSSAAAGGAHAGAAGAGFASGFGGARTSSSVRARSYGYPGGLSREHFVVLMREWVGRGANVDDLFDPSLVHSAPREIRQQLAKALAEEATWSRVVELGIGYTVWNDVDPGPRGTGKVDHVVLGPGGLFAVQSEDWGAPVRLLRGEVSGDGVNPRSTPLGDLERSVRALSRSLRVAFTATLVVLPDDDLDESVVRPERGRKHAPVLVRRSALALILRDGVDGTERASVDRMFELRTQIQERVRFA